MTLISWYTKDSFIHSFIIMKELVKYEVCVYLCLLVFICVYLCLCLFVDLQVRHRCSDEHQTFYSCHWTVIISLHLLHVTPQMICCCGWTEHLFTSIYRPCRSHDSRQTTSDPVWCSAGHAEGVKVIEPSYLVRCVSWKALALTQSDVHNTVSAP